MVNGRQDKRALLALATASLDARESERPEDDRLPSYLEELGPFWRVDLLDPGTGQSPRLQSDAHSFTAYSVGADEKDDGGDLVSERRIADERGYGIRRVRGKDIGSACC